MRYDGTNNQELLDFVESKPARSPRDARIVEYEGHSGVVFNNIGGIPIIVAIFSPAQVDFDEATSSFVVVAEAQS
ncbi:hypothetical protein CMP1-06 [Clavibacter phage CMP1]|uniref:Uncharacterized protein n=1 Tax=Clavibacter phage CMP1 TaxID=686439 RepID=D0U1Z0_9CAUD|nr:hypothetical protein CMP1-06 [Clavibacter phage CMP1]ACY35902.1 hypothetical protein CMP1-06 [Clavibacter phage CMP1]